MAQKKIADLNLRSDFDDTCQLPADDATQTWRITGAQVKAYLAPFTTLGDLIYAGASGVATRLAGNTTATKRFLTQVGNGTISAAPDWQDIKAPTQQIFLSSSGTYTKPAGVLYLRVRMVGGGGGGAGSGSGSPGNGATGNNTTFGSSFLVCNGGAGGVFNAQGGIGGTATNSGADSTTGITIQGQRGMSAVNSAAFARGGCGGSTPFGGGGMGQFAVIGQDAVSGTGGGGGGGNSAATVVSLGAGGGGGGFLDVIIAAPAATYVYAVAGQTTNAAAGTNGFNGGVGAGGKIEVTEYYQ